MDEPRNLRCSMRTSIARKLKPLTHAYQPDRWNASPTGPCGSSTTKRSAGFHVVFPLEQQACFAGRAVSSDNLEHAPRRSLRFLRSTLDDFRGELIRTESEARVILHDGGVLRRLIG